MQVKISKNAHRNWENNAIQFPRLIAELEASGAFTQEICATLCESMDLDMDDLDNLVTRAQDIWEEIKEATENA
jgi:hypothetical protein